ncbi:MAG TPA: Asp-tRNA(Asn)/Glu-tRNA(Gln) amidotransferase subunit GatA [Thermodesulfobacteriota bacterium]|nr:Asp-tRNA(Asn)/Glu-tRNA(Gln) amidotransferase subunit GatA [Thermodesulfobacteriota bacterium]
MSETLADLSLAELAERLSRREATAVEATRAALARIEALEPTLHAFLTVTAESALVEAERVDRERAAGRPLSPLAGVPIALKDIFCTAGVRTTCASRILGDYVPPYDATVVTRLKAARAVLVGKTNMDEFAMGSSTENSAFGVTRNPWDPDRTPGGSSGGSAAAVAAGEAAGALGTDTGGSIRQPAALCGVSGLKPTYGRVSRYGMVAFASSLDQAGPFGRSALDCALLLEAIAGHDPLDSTSVDRPVPPCAEALRRAGEGGARGLTIGLPREFFGEGLDPEVARLTREAARTFEGLGARLVEVSLPYSMRGLPAYYIVAPAEASSNLARYDGVRYGYRARAPESLLDMYERTRAEGFGPEVKRRILLGTYALSAGYYEAYYLKASQVRTLVARDFERAFAAADLLLTPTSPTTAFPLGAKTGDPLQMYLSDVYTIPANLAGLPALSIPCGFAGGLPVGVQLIGRPFDELTLLKAAHAYQQVTDHHRRRPPLAAGGPGGPAPGGQVRP